jgi:hypothetical protein
MENLRNDKTSLSDENFKLTNQMNELNNRLK